MLESNSRTPEFFFVLAKDQFGPLVKYFFSLVNNKYESFGRLVDFSRADNAGKNLTSNLKTYRRLPGISI